MCVHLYRVPINMSVRNVHACSLRVFFQMRVFISSHFAALLLPIPTPVCQQLSQEVLQKGGIPNPVDKTAISVAVLKDHEVGRDEKHKMTLAA
ncbi:unnamed protein product [Brugia pahangi]|uniref:Enolase_N domain-containing protein n=1 Tax=Brugia pahangi TaxID=6280 RepID=A0A0N4TTW5_BRUPA|nr:unnamed protein product [Brugia pahangi]